MATRESDQQVAQEVSQMKKDPERRWSSLLGGLAVGAAGLRRGGVRGALMAMLGGTLFSRGFENASPPPIQDPEANVKNFAERQGELAKRQPLTGTPHQGDTEYRKPHTP